MRSSTASKHKGGRLFALSIALVFALAAVSLFVGKYPLTISGILTEGVEQRVFLRMRLPRMLVGLFGGFALGAAGYVFQTVFKNPLAAPDMIGVTSGASVGAAASILFASSALVVTVSAFVGAVAALLLTAAISSLIPHKDRAGVVLAGVAVHAIAQTAIVVLKLEADPERELASIEYWMMGGLNGVGPKSLSALLPVAAVGSLVCLLFFRQILLLAMDDTESRMLGVPVERMRWFLLLVASLMVASVISVTGLISFVSLLGAHLARMIIRRDSRVTLAQSGLCGAFLLLLGDMLARTVGTSELPVSIFTSLIGAPFLVYLLIGRKRHV